MFREPSRSRVCIVEDNLPLAENLCELLAEIHVETRIATSAKEAMTLARESKCDLYLVDVQLPDGNGTELLQELRVLNPDAEIVLMTGNAEIETAVDAVRLGAFAYVLKPFDPTSLVQTCERALAQVHLRHERAALAKALSDSEALYRSVVETVESVILGVDPDGTIRLVNAFALDLLGDTPGGTRFAEVFADEAQRDELEAAFARAAAGDSVRDVEIGCTLRGRRRLIRWSLKTLDAEGQLHPTVLVVGTDETERRELQRRSAESEALAAVGTLTAGLAHEIRNPLNAASLQLQALERRVKRMGEDGAPLLTKAQLVRTELSRLTKMLSDFLGLARPQGLDGGVFSVRKLLDDVAELERPVCEEQGLALEVEGDPELRAYGDVARLRQVVINLVGNARDAMRESADGSVRLEVDLAPDEMIQVRVIDSGVGFEVEEEELFQPFFTTKAAGTGLGLSIVDKIIRMHGGEIHLRSRPGEGTTAEFTLPRRR